MNGLAGWYFVAYLAFPGAHYLGPMTPAQCSQVAAVIPTLGYCEEVTVLQYCAVDGQPGTGTVCPVFRPRPQITVKP